jgi:hypothetical protein
MIKLKNFFYINLVLILLFSLIDSILFNVLKDKLYEYRFTTAGRINSLIQRQAFSSHYRSRKPCVAKNKILFIGTSTVVNGIDVDILSGDPKNRDFCFLNLGQTGLMASEVYLLKNDYFYDSKSIIVHLYDSFNFGDRYQPKAADSRWNTLNYFKISGFQKIYKNRNLIFNGLLSEFFSVWRYSEIYKGLFRGAPVNSNNKDYNYPIKEKIKTKEELESKVFRDHLWMKKAFIESSTDFKGIGYKSFIEFLKEANTLKRKVFVSPIPEPIFAKDNFYRKNTNNATFIPRSNFSYIEENHEYFRDWMHLHPNGRAVYTKNLWKIICESLKKDSVIENFSC